MSAPAQAQTAPEHDRAPEIAVDRTIPEDDSTYGSTISNLTESINSDAVNFPIVNGRRYHAYQNGVAQYAFPNDESEMDRLDIMHGMIYKALGDKLFLAPLEEEKVQRALDLGTGTGIWAMDFSDQFTNAEVIGIDLSPIQPGWVPPNVIFQVDDMEQDWTFRHRFDYIFARYLACSLKDYKAVIRRAFENLNSGGWVEFQDMDCIITSDDGTLKPDSTLVKWNLAAAAASAKVGIEFSPGPKIAGWFTDVGFTNVRERVIKLPWGLWPSDARNKEIGLWNLRQLVDGLEGMSLRLFCEVEGWTYEETAVLLAGVRKEFNSPKVHGYYNLHAVYAQKP